MSRFHKITFIFFLALLCVMGCSKDKTTAKMQEGPADPASDPASTLPSNTGTAATPQFSAAGTNACLLKDGGVKCWGRNFNGQLGNNSTIDSSIPVQVQGLTSGVTSISSGHGVACAVVNGAAKCWGVNYKGQLGNNDINNSSVPVQVQGLTSGVTAISSGNLHACAIVKGAVKCWGGNVEGGLGNGTTTDSRVPVAVQGLPAGASAIAVSINSSCAIVSGEVYCWGGFPLGNNTIDASPTPIKVPGLSGVTQISLSEFNACALAGGSVFCWGGNLYGQAGNGTMTATGEVPSTLLPVKVEGLPAAATSLSLGARHGCAISNGGLYCWGSFVSNGTSYSISLRATAMPGLSSGLSEIGSGDIFDCVLKDFKPVCLGENSYGQLGNGTTTRAYNPVSVVGY